jgi:hypothetical protein
VNLTNPITVEATATDDNTLLADIARLVAAAEQGRGADGRLADRAARLYAPAVHILGAATLTAWLLLGAGFEQALTYAIAVLIITCPCALALAVPAVCLFFVIRAMHIRKIQAREAAGPAGVGVERARDLLWSLSHGLLPQTVSPRDIPTDATEPVFLYAPLTYARHLQAGSSARRMLVTARSVTPDGGAGWGPSAPAAVAATDRRLLLLLPDALLDIPYSDITGVNLDRGLVVLSVHSGMPVLLAGEAAESLAVLAVWGSVGESALRRHPAMAGLRP